MKHISRIQFFEGSVLVGEFTSDIIFTSDFDHINTKRVKYLLKAVASCSMVPDGNISIMAYDKEDNLLFKGNYYQP